MMMVTFVNVTACGWHWWGLRRMQNFPLPWTNPCQCDDLSFVVTILISCPPMLVPTCIMLWGFFPFCQTHQTLSPGLTVTTLGSNPESVTWMVTFYNNKMTRSIKEYLTEHGSLIQNITVLLAVATWRTLEPACTMTEHVERLSWASLTL